ncbi:MAG: hypothetical protein K2O40_02880 [Lachnospiraceae bacterium]|nr:hypothetical protein [Lachnospiraceae bacterium]
MSNIETIIVLIIAIISIVYALCERTANKVLCRWIKDKGIMPDAKEVREYTEKIIKEFFKTKG